MGANDSAQIADLIGIYIFDTQVRIIDLKQVGLYSSSSYIAMAPKLGKFMENWKLLLLKIEISSKLKIVNFVDITFTLTKNALKPFPLI